MPRGRQRIDLTGQKFGYFTVLHKGTNARERTRWVCLCKCGRKKSVATQSLRKGTSTSCGCRRKTERPHNYSHGSQSNRLWRIWRGMCTRSPVRDERVLRIYKGPGTVDPDWLSYETFEAWAKKNGYRDHLSIDRIDNDIGYWPSNCRWATMHQQNNNKTVNVVLTVGGRRLTATQAASEFGVTAVTIRKRVKNGWPDEEAVKRLNPYDAAIKHRLYGGK